MWSATPAWLEKLLRVSETADRRVLSIILVILLTAFSTVFAAGLALLLQIGLGWQDDPRLVLTVGAIAALTSFSAACPGVAFASMMSARLKSTQRQLDSALSEARMANRAKSEFLANMSHEIRTPLNGVMGMAQVLEATNLSGSQQSLVADIRESGNLLLTIVNDVLDLSKIEAGKIEIIPEPGDLKAAVTAATRLFETQAAEKGTRLQIVFGTDLPACVRFDAMRVRQCLGNLVSNAVKFTSGGEVRVQVTVDGDGTRGEVISICVTDTGIGISLAAQERLFSTFTQADASIERRYGGTGLGLAISRRLAILMGGDITLESEPGAGSSFTLTFRIERCEFPTNEEVLLASVQQTVGLRNDARVLVADDNAINRRVVSLLMAPLGVEILEAENGEEVLGLLDTSSFDLVLLDVHMPVLNGEATIARIRNVNKPWSAVPVIALTADTMNGDRERLLAIGMSGYVAKPIIVADLYAEINRVMTGTSGSTAI